jgi:oxaloacetate decarboxylase (Na+ extruding) subunit gamma
MNEIFSTALMLLAVGMLTVFFILALIVFFGDVLIRLVNRFFPEEAPVAREVLPATADPGALAAIVAAVEHITHGKGRVTGIRKADG